MRIKKRPLNRPVSELSNRYVNREYSWLQFNQRVLEEAENPRVPLFERLKFLAIFESNLDEFYMVRVSGLIEQHEGGIQDLTPDGLTPSEQLTMIAEVARVLRQRAANQWSDVLRPALEEKGVRIRNIADLPIEKQMELRQYFREEVFPLCTPLILHPAPNVPFISNRSLNLAVTLKGKSKGIYIGRVKIPSVIPRVIEVSPGSLEFVLLEDLVKHNLDSLYPGTKIQSANLFRVIRDADVEIKDLEAADLVNAIEESIRERRFGAPVLLEIEEGTPTSVRNTLMKLLELDSDDVFDVRGLIGMDMLSQIAKLDLPDLRFPQFSPIKTEALSTPQSLFSIIAERDVLVHHPFDSFSPVENFVRSAAQDPDVIGIKQTLYRAGAKSPIVEALLEAAERGKQVAVMVELKARFDESNNLVWARALERAGVHVSYGFPNMKVHCKLCSVVRREGGKLKSYVHIGTGNYNPDTARLYTDVGLFTSDPDITRDVQELFNYLTGLSNPMEYRQLLVAPDNLRDKVIQRIEREIDCHRQYGNGRIIIKLNSLVDPEVIESLYDASNVGVQVDLLVRGISCVRPGIPGMSENIRVKSVVGRFLEHSRVYYFGNGGTPEALIGSSDLMRRNLDRRIEVLVPVRSEVLTRMLHDNLLSIYLQDNTNSWIMQSDGSSQRKIEDGENAFSAQKYLIQHPFAPHQVPGK